MRIFITGIAGFLGSHLAKALLDEGHEVQGNDNFLCGDPFNVWGFKPVDILHYIDCRDFSRMRTVLSSFKPDVIVHAAATAHEGVSNFSPSFICSNIYEASLATFSAAIASGVKRVVYMSSMSRYGDNVPPFTEDMQPKPCDPYAVAKVATEDTLRILAETHGIKYSILVPHSIVGTKQNYRDPMRNVASIMMNRCLQGKPPVIYGDGLQTRCFSPVADCLPSIIKAVHGEADGEIVNIGPDDGEITILDLAQRVAKLTGFEGEFEFHPDRPNEVKHAYCSSDKVRKLLGFEPKQSLDNCLREMVEDIKRRGTMPFKYSFPLEIVNDRTPRTWVDQLI